MNSPSIDFTVGSAPGNNQVNLGAMRSNLNGVLAPGMLGNNVANPMSGVLANGGDASMGLQNAIANSRMQQLALQQKQEQEAQRMKQWEMDQQKPGLLDYLGLLMSGGSTLKNAGAFDDNYQPQVDFSQPDWSQFDV